MSEVWSKKFWGDGKFASKKRKANIWRSWKMGKRRWSLKEWGRRGSFRKSWKISPGDPEGLLVPVGLHWIWDPSVHGTRKAVGFFFSPRVRTLNMDSMAVLVSMLWTFFLLSTELFVWPACSCNFYSRARMFRLRMPFLCFALLCFFLDVKGNEAHRPVSGRSGHFCFVFISNLPIGELTYIYALKTENKLSIASKSVLLFFYIQEEGYVRCVLVGHKEQVLETGTFVWTRIQGKIIRL